MAPAGPARRALLQGAAFAWLGATPPAGGQAVRVLTVGAGAQFETLQAAVAKARDGDRIDILPGTYRGEGVHVQGRLHVRGLGAGAVFEATGRPPADRGVLVVQGDVKIENLSLRRARRVHGNGAGIRFLDGRLELRRCTFSDNEVGLLGSDQAQAELRLLDCVFANAPRHPIGLHHLLYASTMARLEVQGCRFEGGWRGHLLKSRARHNDIRYNLLRDGPNGEASYELELAEGGHNTVIGNVIVQAPGTQNRSIVAVGYNARPELDHGLVFAYNTVVNQAWWPARFLRIWDQALRHRRDCTVMHNLFVGRGGTGIPRGSNSDGNQQLPLAALEDVGADRFRLKAACGGAAAGDALPAASEWLPRRQFQLPVGTLERTPDRCPGALGT